MDILLFLLSFFVCTTLYLLFRRSSPNKKIRKIRKPIEEILMHPEDIHYTSREPYAPLLTGPLLKFLCRLQHTVFGKNIMTPFLSKKNGVDLLEGEYIPENATFSPAAIPLPSRPPPTSAGTNEAVLMSLVEDHATSSQIRTSVDFYKAYKSGKCNPEDVAKSVLELIALSNHSNSHSPLRAIVKVDEQEVLRMAQESTKRWNNGKPLSFLDGVPVSIKGNYEVLPYDCFAGVSFKPVLSKSIFAKESILVSRLKKAGAIIIGIANLQEYCAGITGSNPNDAYQTARNPYNTQHYCGGSSSGSACSVAAGLCTISLGSDAGGSIRIPAAHCGVVGLKPTYGLLDLTGAASFTQTVGVLGPLSASVLDTAIVMDILCPDKGKLDLSDLQNNDLEGVKLGVFWEFFEHADEEIVAACKLAIDKMVGIGAECVNIKIPELNEALAAQVNTVSAEFGLSIAPDIDSNFHKLSSESLFLVGYGYTVTAVDYINCQKQRTRSIRTLEMLFDEVDVIITPSTACTAPIIPPGGDKYGMVSNQVTSKSLRFIALGNLTGIPGIAVPVGMSSAGLPISLQIMGPWYEEGRLMHIAGKLQNEIATEVKRPEVYYDVLDHACTHD